MAIMPMSFFGVVFPPAENFAIAARGVRFENAFVSQSICWMSRTTILTGLTGRSFGQKASPESARPEVVKTLYSDLLRTHGYRTGHIGK